MKNFDINKIADLAMLALNEDELCALQKKGSVRWAHSVLRIR